MKYIFGVEKMNRNINIKSLGKNLFFATLITFLIALLLGKLFNSDNNGGIIRLLSIRQKDIDYVINTVWTVQASITTLTIAIMALVVSMNKEKKYGFKLLNYLFVIKPKFLKFHEEIVLNIVLLFITYYFVAFQLLASVVFVFFINVVLIIKMVLTSVQLVLFDEQVETQLIDHILHNFQVEIEEENKKLLKGKA
jgi:hypothetical protein